MCRIGNLFLFLQYFNVLIVTAKYRSKYTDVEYIQDFSFRSNFKDSNVVSSSFTQLPFSKLNKNSIFNSAKGIYV